MQKSLINWEFNSKASEAVGDSSFRKWPRVISVSSGKGGVGKTNVVANLALAFTQLSKKVLVLDADLGLANMDVLLGLNPQYTLEHLFDGEKCLSDILIKGPGGMLILPASSGIPELADLDESQKILLLNEMDLLAEPVDILLIDTGSGISSNVLYFNVAAKESIVLVTAEPTSITDGYALIKVLSIKHQKNNFLILINQVPDARKAREVFKQISSAVDCFLADLSVDYLGFIPSDPSLPSAVKKRRLVLEMHPQAPSSRSFRAIARNLAEKPSRIGLSGNVQFFSKQLFQFRQSAPRQGGAD